MTGYEPYLALGLLVILLAAFLNERFAPEVTASGGAALFIIFGLVPSQDVLAAFANPAPNWPVVGTALFLLVTLVLSGVMNNTPVVLVLIPVAIRLAKSLDRSHPPADPIVLYGGVGRNLHLDRHLDQPSGGWGGARKRLGAVFDPGDNRL